MGKLPPKTKRGDRGAQGTQLAPFQATRVRALIETERTVKRLQSFLFGDFPTKKSKLSKSFMTSDQIRVAELLLKKTLPDLASVDEDGNATLTVNHTVLVSKALEKLDSQFRRLAKPVKEIELVANPD